VTRLALLRHGHTPWNRAGRIQGRTDIPLDPEAEADLAALRLPPPWDAATLWSSPLARAAQTATLVAGRVPRSDPALMEMDWGDWEGQRGIELRSTPGSGFRDIEDWGWDYTPPGGESPDALRIRLDSWLKALAGDNVAVCHIGVMRVVLAMATGWNFAGPAPFQIKRNRLFVVACQDGRWQLDPEPIRLIRRPI